MSKGNGAYSGRITIFLSAVLVSGLLELPYSLYVVIKLISFIAFGYFALKCTQKDFTFGISIFFAIIFNPLFRIHLMREIWIVIDLFAAFFVVYLYIKNNKDSSQSDKTPSLYVENEIKRIQEDLHTNVKLSNEKTWEFYKIIINELGLERFEKEEELKKDNFSELLDSSLINRVEIATKSVGRDNGSPLPVLAYKITLKKVIVLMYDLKIREEQAKNKRAMG